MSGSIRIGNKRAGSSEKPHPGETVIDGDRKNPILGNPFILKNHNDDRERAQVIADYNEKFTADWEANGPMKKETERLAKRVTAGEKIILMCWCVGKPHNRPCHLDIVKGKIEFLTR